MLVLQEAGPGSCYSKQDRAVEKGRSLWLSGYVLKLVLVGSDLLIGLDESA